MRQAASIVAAALAALAVASPGAAAPGTGTVRGTVTVGGSGRGGVAVEVYLEPRKSTAGGAPFALAESGPGGGFEIVLPPGEYYLWGRSPAPAFGPPLVTEHPGNPVRVEAGRETVLAPLAMREAGAGPDQPPEGTGISGRATFEGRPAAEVAVMVYDAAEGKLTGPGFAAAALTGEDGRFQAQLPPGSYRVVARRRAGGEASGFLREGDLTSEPTGPLSVESGRQVDVGVLALRQVDPAALAERQRERRSGAGPTRLSGTVRDGQGRPLAGQYVFAYRDQGMIGRPDLMAVTGQDGSFLLDLPGGGTWHIGARSTMGGPRQPGEMVGRLAGSPDSSVTLRDGEARQGLLIPMEAVW